MTMIDEREENNKSKIPQIIDRMFVPVKYVM